MHRKLMFTALEYMFTVRKLMFTACKHNFSRCKDTSFFRYHQIKLLFIFDIYI